MPTGIMEAVITIFRTMDTFDYSKFRQELKALSFNATHREMLSLHLSLLESCVKGGNTENRASTYFKKGHLTIIECVLSLFDWRAWLTRAIKTAYRLHSWTGLAHVPSST